jgi:rfaE bifunctional protein nucleotidyltransferase chain/domain
MLDKVITIAKAQTIRRQAKAAGKKVVFTNGVFDILHRGHVEYLQKARELGDLLILGLNSDASVRSIKGPKRPLCPQEDRAIGPHSAV